LWIIRFFPTLQTSRTDTGVLHAAVDKTIAAAIIRHGRQKVNGWAVNIVHPAAFYADHMVVTPNVAVEPRLLLVKTQLLDGSLPGEQLQVAIDRAQADLADFGQPPTHNLMQPYGGGVRGELF
jgi:hypothetical protein